VDQRRGDRRPAKSLAALGEEKWESRGPPRGQSGITKANVKKNGTPRASISRWIGEGKKNKMTGESKRGDSADYRARRSSGQVSRGKVRKGRRCLWNEEDSEKIFHLRRDKSRASNGSSIHQTGIRQLQPTRNRRAFSKQKLFYSRCQEWS